MDYFHKIRSTVTSVAAQVSNALPGNPVTREYEILAQTASAGPGLSWKIYNGKKRSTEQAVSVWIFEKKKLDSWQKRDREVFLEVLKKGVLQLTKLRHPRILVVEHPLEESRDSFAFCTEPVFASLANCLGRNDNLDSPLPFHLAEFELLELEIKHGLFQLTEALSFLHIDARMLHRNICPESIIVSSKGAWKLSGFEFAVQGSSGPVGQSSFEMFEWDQRTITFVQPSLDYLAPEYVVGGRCDAYADMFSLGCLSVAIFNKCKPPFENYNTLEIFKKNVEKLKTLSASALVNVPSSFREDLKMCLNFTPDLRPDATQFSKIGFFDDPLTKVLNYFDSLCQMDNSQKMQFFKGLPQILSKFPKRPLLQKVLPYLSAEFTTPDLIPFILPSVFLIAEQSTNAEFATVILPHLIPVFAMERPYQIVLLLLQKMELLLQKTAEEDIRKYILPLVCNAISSDTTRIQELCLSIIPNIGKLMDRSAMKIQLLPKLLRLTTHAGVLGVRVQALICLGKLLPHLEPWMVSDQIIPALPKVNSKEPGILMAILGIYKLVYENEKLGISKEQCAKSVLPFLISMCVENTLNLAQFEQFVSLIHQLLNKVEKEQRQRLQQLTASQEEQRQIPDFAEIIGKQNTTDTVKSNEDLSILAESQSFTESSSHLAKISSGRLTLEDKKRLAAEQEQNLRLRSQSPIVQPLNGKLNDPFSMSADSASISGLDSMLSLAPNSAKIGSNGILAPVKSVMTPSTAPAFDISEFLPKSGTNYSNISKVSPNPPNFPATSEFSECNSSQKLFDDKIAFNTGPSVGLPQPPKASNPVIRNPNQNLIGSGLGGFPKKYDTVGKPDLSALDNLFSFPKSTSTSLDNNKLFTVGSKPLSISQPKKDPFADLLG